MEDTIRKYKEDGYVILKGIIDDSQINDLKDYIKTLKIGLKVPYSDEAWGYGNCLNLERFEVITNNSKMLSTLSELLSSGYIFNHLMVNRKPPWIGPEVEYHQEVFNSRTFAPGASVDDLVNNWRQVYIALDSETCSNGGLRIITKSHLLGKLKSEDMVNQNYSHKRRIPVKILNDLAKKSEHHLLDLDLQAGDCLIFSPLLIHGSPSNGTPSERISIVLQARRDNFTPNESIFKSETEYRNSFLMQSLRQNIRKVEYHHSV